MIKCTCINPTFRALYIDVDCFTVKDTISSETTGREIVYLMCPRCYDRVKRLTGYRILYYPRNKSLAQAEVQAEVIKPSTPF